MTKIIGAVVLGLVGIAGVLAYSGGESPSETLKRTREYVKHVGAVQTAQDKLNSFIEAQQKACTSKQQVLQLSPQGLLACVAAPQATPSTTAPATVKK